MRFGLNNRPIELRFKDIFDNRYLVKYCLGSGQFSDDLSKKFIM
jgi:hypothetical protein